MIPNKSAFLPSVSLLLHHHHHFTTIPPNQVIMIPWFVTTCPFPGISPLSHPPSRAAGQEPPSRLCEMKKSHLSLSVMHEHVVVVLVDLELEMLLRF